MMRKLVLALVAISLEWFSMTTRERDVVPTTDNVFSTQESSDRTMAIRLQACLKELSTLTEVYYINNGIYADHLSVMTANMDVCDNMIVETRVANEDDYHFIARAAGMAFEVRLSEGIQTYD